MKFRPCIDLHSGQVKQIVGSTLKDTPAEEDDLATNFETDRPAGKFKFNLSSPHFTCTHVH